MNTKVSEFVGKAIKHIEFICPYCGSDTMLLDNAESDGNNSAIYCHCQNCNAKLLIKTECELGVVGE